MNSRSSTCRRLTGLLQVFVDENQQSVVCIDSEGAYSAVPIRADADGQPQAQPTHCIEVSTLLTIRSNL